MKPGFAEARAMVKGWAAPPESAGVNTGMAVHSVHHGWVEEALGIEPAIPMPVTHVDAPTSEGGVVPTITKLWRELYWLYERTHAADVEHGAGWNHVRDRGYRPTQWWKLGVHERSTEILPTTPYPNPSSFSCPGCETGPDAWFPVPATAPTEAEWLATCRAKLRPADWNTLRAELVKRGVAVPVEPDEPPVEPPEPEPADPYVLKLHGGRFEVMARFKTDDGVATATPMLKLSEESGLFWFYSAGNAELLVKVLDFRAVSSSWGLYCGAATDQAYEIQVLDVLTGVRFARKSLGGFENASFGQVDALPEPPGEE